MRGILLAYLFHSLIMSLFDDFGLGLANTYGGLVLAYVTFTFPFSTWMLTAYFREMPYELRRRDVSTEPVTGLCSFVILPLAITWNRHRCHLRVHQCMERCPARIDHPGGGAKRTLR